MSRKLLLLMGVVALLLIQSSMAQEDVTAALLQQDAMKVCGEYEGSPDNSKCNGLDGEYAGCLKCKKCKGGRVSKGWMNFEKFVKEILNKSYGCHSIIVWLLPVIAGIIVIAAIIAFICWRKKKNQPHTYPVAAPGLAPVVQAPVAAYR